MSGQRTRRAARCERVRESALGQPELGRHHRPRRADASPYPSLISTRGPAPTPSCSRRTQRLPSSSLASRIRSDHPGEGDGAGGDGFGPSQAAIARQKQTRADCAAPFTVLGSSISVRVQVRFRVRSAIRSPHSNVNLGLMNQKHQTIIWRPSSSVRHKALR